MKLMHGTFCFFTELNITHPYQKINYFGKMVAKILEKHWITGYFLLVSKKI